MSHFWLDGCSQSVPSVGGSVLIWRGARIVPNPQRLNSADMLRVGTTRAPPANLKFKSGHCPVVRRSRRGSRGRSPHQSKNAVTNRPACLAATGIIYMVDSGMTCDLCKTPDSDGARSIAPRSLLTFRAEQCSALRNLARPRSETPRELAAGDGSRTVSRCARSPALDAKVLDDRLGPAADVKLLEDVGQMIAHGAGGNARLLRNLLV